MQAEFDRHHQGDAEEAGGGDGGDDEARHGGDNAVEQVRPFLLEDIPFQIHANESGNCSYLSSFPFQRIPLRIGRPSVWIFPPCILPSKLTARSLVIPPS